MYLKMKTKRVQLLMKLSIHEKITSKSKVMDLSVNEYINSVLGASVKE